ncbi:MAG TPA: type II secretion system protein [Gemmatales bacterium]|nr:type II secretion system protein [Gemmatales bacterium]
MRLTAKQPRNAFTLIELIVVMAIIVVLATLGIGAMSKSFNWIKQKNTEQTMTKVINRFQRVIDRLYKEADDWPSITEQFILDQAAGSFERARVLKVLYLYKWNFPNSYAEAYHNVQESRQLYDNNPTAGFPGYPAAKSILARLRKNNPSIPDPFALPFNARVNFSTPYSGTETYSPWPGGTPTTANMAKVIPEQSAACMLASFGLANGSPDEFTNEEVIVDPSSGDSNPRLTDAWGTPLLCLRHGNFIYSRHRVGNGGADRSAWSMGMVSNTADPLDFAPLEYVLNPSTALPPLPGGTTSFYFRQLQARSQATYPSLSTTDPFDPTGLLKSNQQWRTNNVSNLPPGLPTLNCWLAPALSPWLASPNAGNPPQHVTMFRRTFGYMPEELTPLGVPNQAYCPMVIISAGGDKIFSNWDDNLDSYRLKINVSGQQ